MKKKKIIFPAVTFVMGAVIGITLFAFFSFKMNDPAPPPQGVRVISESDANTMFKRYFSSAIITATIVKGYSLDTLQLNAMKLIKNSNKEVSGFRVYLGKDANGAAVGIVVGLDSRGSDAVSSGIYMTESPNTGPCPPLCDQNSPIIR